VVSAPYQRFFPVRIDWHTSGQAFLWEYNRLVGYQNALSPGARFDFNELVVGQPETELTGRQEYELAGIFVRALSRADALTALVRELPGIDASDDPLLKRCHSRLTEDLLARLDRIRSFMTLVHAALSQPWSAAESEDATPFRPEASRAHDLARNVALQLKHILRSGDYASSDALLSDLTEFLEIVRDAVPEEFEQLAADLSEPPALGPDCETVLNAAQSRYYNELAQLLNLMTEVGIRINQIASG
jgi:hypothetical protein